MRVLLERFIISSTPAWRVLLAVFAAIPFFIILVAAFGYALVDPDIRAGIRPEVVMIVLGCLVLVTVSVAAPAIWLWPRRHLPDPVPRMTLLACLAIGGGYTASAVAMGTFTDPSSLVLLGVLAVGLLLFDQRPMVIAYAFSVVVISAQDLGVIAGLWPYAPALREGVIRHGEPVWWISIWRNYVAVAGYSVLLALIFLLFERLDELHAQLKRLSYTDGLTGLANRRRAMEVLQTEVARQRRTGQVLSLVLIDADHFKQVNDQHGHDMGDEVLRTLGRLLMACVRSPTDVACRLGGEEFALILPDTSREQVMTVCERLRSELARHTFGQGEQAFRVTLSMGVAEGVAQDVETLLQEADHQLYRAKNEGRDRVCAGSPGGGA